MSADVHNLVGAYVLDALPELEAARFARHLAACPECRAEVTELLEVTGHLAAGVAGAPPPALRARVLAEARRTRQAGPGVAAVGRPPRALVLPAVAAAVATVLVLGAAALGGVLRGPAGPDPAAVAEVLAAPDATSIPLGGEDGAAGTVVLAPGRAAAVVAIDGLPEGDGTAVVWLLRDGEPGNAGTLPRDTRTGVVLLPAVDGAAAVAVTLEPDPTTPTPTTPILATAPLP